MPRAPPGSWTLTLLTLLALALALPAARAHTVEADHGEFTIEYVDAGFTCADVYLVGRHFDADEAHFTLWVSREGSAPDERIDEGTFTAEPEEDGNGYAFALGPYNLGETGDADGYDFAITWADADGGHEIHVPFDGDCLDDARLPPCEHDNVTAVANDDGTVTLQWTELSQHVEIYRDGEHVASVNTTGMNGGSWTDTATTGGNTYAYELRFMYGDSHSDRACLHVTAVPFFGAPLLGALALVGAVGVYAAMRRR